MNKKELMEMKNYVLYLKENGEVANSLYVRRKFVKEVLEKLDTAKIVVNNPDLARFTVRYPGIFHVIYTYPDFLPIFFSYLYGEGDAYTLEIAEVQSVSEVTPDQMGVVFVPKRIDYPAFSLELPVGVWKGVYTKLLNMGITPDVPMPKEYILWGGEEVVIPSPPLPIPVHVEKKGDMFYFTFNDRLTLELDPGEVDKLGGFIKILLFDEGKEEEG